MSNFEGAMDNARQFTETLCQIIESLEAEIAELRLDAKRAAISQRKVNKWDGLCADVGVGPDSTISTVREVIERGAGQSLQCHNEDLAKWLKEYDERISRLAATTAIPRIKADDFPCCSDTPVTAEAIRASEPGSTWEDRHGAAWEWTGGGMAYHSQFGDLGEESLTEYVVQQSGPFTRSTVAPRGDYSAPVKDVDTSAPSLKENGENFTRPTRLSVHALNVAPVGSAIYGRNLGKGPDERWWCGPYNYSAEDLVANGWADATLTYPERGDDE